LKSFADRPAAADSAQALMRKVTAEGAAVREARIVAFNLPAIIGLSTSGSFKYMLEALEGQAPADVNNVMSGVIGTASRDRSLARVFSTYTASNPMVFLDIDRGKGQALGLNMSDVFTALEAALDGIYVNMPDWMPITPKTGALFHAYSQSAGQCAIAGAHACGRRAQPTLRPRHGELRRIGAPARLETSQRIPLAAFYDRLGRAAAGLSMCNDYGNHIPYDDYLRAFSQTRIPVRWPKAAPNLEPRDDIWPTDTAPVIRQTDEGVEFTQLRWGFPPARPKGPPVINFRSEGRRFPKGRCLVPASHSMSSPARSRRRPSGSSPKRARIGSASPVCGGRCRKGRLPRPAASCSFT
jgi:hypothetical protein